MLSIFRGSLQQCAKSISKCAEEDNAEARTCRWDADANADFCTAKSASSNATFCIDLRIWMRISVHTVGI